MLYVRDGPEAANEERGVGSSGGGAGGKTEGG